MSSCQRMCLGVVVLLSCLSSSASAGIINFTLTEDGGGAGIISATVSGALTFSANGQDNTGQFSNYIAPANGTVGFGSSSTLTQGWLKNGALSLGSSSPINTLGYVFAPFGTGGYAPGVIENYTGDPIFLYTNSIAIERGYVSDTTISGSGTINGDFQTLGIVAGTATTVFTLNGIENTVNVVAATAPAPAAVPEPSTAFAMGLFGVISFVGNRRRRRRPATA